MSRTRGVERRGVEFHDEAHRRTAVSAVARFIVAAIVIVLIGILPWVGVGKPQLAGAAPIEPPTVSTGSTSAEFTTDRPRPTPPPTSLERSEHHREPNLPTSFESAIPDPLPAPAPVRSPGPQPNRAAVQSGEPTDPSTKVEPPEDAPAEIERLLMSDSYENWEDAATRITRLFQSEKDASKLAWAEDLIVRALVEDPPNEQRRNVLFSQCLESNVARSQDVVLSILIRLALHEGVSRVRQQATETLRVFGATPTLWDKLFRRMSTTHAPREFGLLFDSLFEHRPRATIAEAIRRLEDKDSAPVHPAILDRLRRTIGTKNQTADEWTEWWKLNSDRSLIGVIRDLEKKEREEALVRLWNTAYQEFKTKGTPEGWLLIAVHPSQVSALRLRGFEQIGQRAFELERSAREPGELAQLLQSLFLVCVETAANADEAQDIRIEAIKAIARMPVPSLGADTNLRKLVAAALEKVAARPISSFDYDFGKHVVAIVGRLKIPEVDAINRVLEASFPGDGVEWSAGADYPLMTTALESLKEIGPNDESLLLVEKVFANATDPAVRSEVFNVLKAVTANSPESQRQTVLDFYRRRLAKPQPATLRMVIIGLELLRDRGGISILEGVLVDPTLDIKERQRALTTVVDLDPRLGLAAIKRAYASLAADDPLRPDAWQKAVEVCANDTSLARTSEFVAPLEDGTRPPWTERLLSHELIVQLLRFAPNYWNFEGTDPRDPVVFARWSDLELRYAEAVLAPSLPAPGVKLEGSELDRERQSYRQLATRLQRDRAAVPSEAEANGPAADWERERFVQLGEIAELRATLLDRVASGDLTGAEQATRTLIEKSQAGELGDANEVLRWILSRLAALEWRDAEAAYLAKIRGLPQASPPVTLEDETLEWLDRAERRRPGATEPPRTDG